MLHPVFVIIFVQELSVGILKGACMCDVVCQFKIPVPPPRDMVVVFNEAGER